ncbi:MAG TPA: cobyric acid synthase [Acidimicrobiales bacterium]|nr:cobyric acid synthase [Acidimicrobiales bacterium]
MSDLRGALMVCGTASDAGKSHVVAGLCRSLHRRGVRVAPFKAQNMSLNSYVTRDDHEIGRAQAAQAFAARIEPDVTMNPILLKPTSETDCQVVVMGRPLTAVSAAGYHDLKPQLFDTVLAALADLRSRFDVVVLEGAGSPAEINLLDRDIVNLPIAVAAGCRAVVVGDIERGGVFASLLGTVELLPSDQRACVGGFVVNKFRGDPGLLLDGAEQLERRTGVPTLGVLPYVPDVAIDAEDSMAFAGPPPRPSAGVPAMLDVAAIRFPQVSNTTDLDPLAIEPGIAVRWVDSAAALGRPHLIVLPGTKSTVADLAWLRATGLSDAITATTAVVVGICGGYQMLGGSICDDGGVEAAAGADVPGLGLLDVRTDFAPAKTLRQRRGCARGAKVHGYEIHHGATARGDMAPWLELDGEAEGACDERRGVFGTNLHALFDADEFRHRFLLDVARRAGVTYTPTPTSFAAARDAQLDRLADLLEEHLDMAAVDRLIQEAR